MSPDDIYLTVGGVILLVISLSIHEAAHALVATWCGDDTAKLQGRLTLNPIKHLDPMFSIVIPALMLWMSGGKFAFGGAKPVPVNPYRLRHPMRDMAIVALAGPVSNLILAVLFLFAAQFAVNMGWMYEDGQNAILLVLAGKTNLFLAVFNMVPIPPLDGSRVMGYLLPKSVAEPYLRIEQYGIVVVLALLWLGALDPIFRATVNPMYWGIKNFWYSVLGA